MKNLNKLWQLNKRAHDKVSLVYDKKHTEIYNEVEQNRLNKTIEEILIILEQKDNIKVLDFGSGTGNLTLKFLSYNCLVTAIDISEKSLLVLLNKTKKVFGKDRLNTIILTDNKIPLPDNHFDIVATYSVLHHIPDYLFAIQEMMRVTKPGGLIFIDHETNENKWNPNQYLSQYYRITKLTIFEHIRQLLETKELFTYEFFKTVLIKFLINPRYEREGDIHVWPDDHIEWNKIMELLEKQFDIITNSDYLLYKPKGGVELYEKYRCLCTDVKYIVAKKTSNSFA
jgi:ubiquinone/menaquinone biosynthesis C-methylase UbiE